MQFTFHDMRYQLLSALITVDESEGEQRAAEATVDVNALATFNYAVYTGELGCPPIRDSEDAQVGCAVCTHNVQRVPL
jgi:hypothetical protein